jgi:PAS domain S-box-containing protein
LKPQINYTIIEYKNIQELNGERISNNVIKILKQIISSYPFTFLEKESLRKNVDKLDHFFWIKNKYGNCELVNQKLSEYFNSASSQLEENPEDVFFPPEFQRIVKSFNSLTSETKKTILVKGLSFGIKGSSINISLLNIPIIDYENNVIAIICISLNPSMEKMSDTTENYSPINEQINEFPFASAILSKNGLIVKTNQEFQKLVDFSERELTNSSINKVFTTKFSTVLEDFASSLQREILIKSLEFLQKQKYSQLFLLGKVFDEKDISVTILRDSNSELINGLNNERQPNFSMIENLIRNNPDAVLICDKENLKFLEVNEVATNLYGYRRDELLEMDLTDLYSAEDIQLLLTSSSANTREGSFQGPYKHRKKDGTIILVEMCRYSVKFNEREAHFNIVRNISDRLELEKRNQSYKTVFDHTDDLIFITDSSGFICFINQSVTQILGYTKNDLINSSFTSLLPNYDRSRVIHTIFHADKKEESSIEVILKTIDGRFLTAGVIASPIFDFNKEIESLTLICKTKPENQASISEASREKIDDSALLEKSKEKLDSKFLKDLFHELLTPINVILGFAQEITESVAEPTPEQKEASKIIKQNRAHLLQSMNTALEYTSITQEDFNFLADETKITDVIDQLLKDVDDLKTIIDVEFAYGKISSSLSFETDRQRFKNFLLLLFKTVVKLSNQKKIYFSAYPKDTEFFLVTFRDLQTHCSKLLVSSLNNIFENDANRLAKEYGISSVMVKLTKKLLKVLNGKFTIIGEEKDKNDYGIIFPLVYKKEQVEKVIPDVDFEGDEFDKEEIEDSSISSDRKKADITESQFQSEEKTKEKLDQNHELAVKLQNELRIESLRQKIRKQESRKQAEKNEEDSEGIYEESAEDELIEDKIEYYDLDLHEKTDHEIEEEIIEVVETTAPKEKSVQPSAAKQTDEKVDISNLSCLYFEDQIDSQILFSVQMKEMKNINFTVSFEESLPLLDSGNYDFIVIDMNLQGSYNGLDVLRIIRNMPKYENIPIFAVTAYVLPGDQQKFVLAGFNGFISKPIFRDQMIDLLAEVFNEPKQS